jgi:hypothetical protein
MALAASSGTISLIPARTHSPDLRNAAELIRIAVAGGRRGFG